MKKYEQNPWVIIASIFLFTFVLVYTKIPLVYDISDSIEWYWYLLWFPASVAGCIVFNNVCRWIDMFGKKIFKNASCDIPFPILKWIGVNAMTFYVAHGIICRITQEIIGVYYPQWYDTWQGLLIVIVAYVVIIVPLCCIINLIKYKYE